jgi:translation initiation factor IF-2
LSVDARLVLRRALPEVFLPFFIPFSCDELKTLFQRPKMHDRPENDHDVSSSRTRALRVSRGTMRRATLAAFREAISASAAATSHWGGASAGARASWARWAPPRPRVQQNHQWRSLGSSAPSRAAQPRGGRGGGKPGGARGVGAADGARAGTGKKPFKKGTAAKGLPDRFAGLLEDEGDDGDATEKTTLSASSERTKKLFSKSDGRSVSTTHASEAPSPPLIELASDVTVAELAKRLNTNPERVEKILNELGESVASNEDAVGSADLVELVAVELGAENVTVVDARSQTAHRKASRRTDASERAVNEANGDGKHARADPPRRAVVAVMGHVDHGKTTLLDALRSTSVAAGEAGGITQHIGAFVVPLRSGGALTFLDTPGHAAFGAMRKRGASVTDVAVLVCAADDGVMPQTREAAAHIIAAECRYVVALTKCDVPGADPTRVRGELVAAGIPLETAGGDVQSVEVSAVTGFGMEDLEMALFLEAEALGLTAPDSRATDAAGTVLEARLDKGQGAVVSGLLRRGALAVGDDVVAGATFGRVRRLRGADGRELNYVGPSDPFELTGLRAMPAAGDPIQRVVSEERARRVAAAREARAAAAAAAADGGFGAPRVFDLEHTHAPSGERGKAAAKKTAAKSKLRASGVGAREGAASGLLEDEMRSGAFGEDGSRKHSALRANTLCCVVKADVQGTAEAVRDALLSLSTERVGVKVVYQGTGAVTESDVSLAGAVGGVVLAFNVKHGAETEKLAKAENVLVVRRTVIYHLLDAVGEMLGGLAPETLEEEVCGEAEVRQVFDLSTRRGNKANTVAGCVVHRGSLDGDEKFRVVRGGAVAHDGLLDAASIRRHRLEVRVVGKGTDCGLNLAGFEDIRAGDIVQCVRFVKKKAAVEKVQSGGSRVV